MKYLTEEQFVTKVYSGERLETELNGLKYPTYPWEETVYMPTSMDFFGNYVLDGVEYCQASLYKQDSNLDLWTIHLSGDDDFSLSFDCIGESEARHKWGSLFDNDTITEVLLKGWYFSG